MNVCSVPASPNVGSMPKKPQKDEIKDEPGADERFGKILGKVLHTPPKHKDTKAGVTRKKGKPK